MGDLLAELVRLDADILYRRAPKNSQQWFNVVEGSIPVIVSAPHACMHIRGGVEKMEEEFTGAIARYLANTTSCHAIYASRMTTEDPNWQATGSYKEAVARLIKQYGIRFLIDLHGMTNRYNMGVALGTMNGRSCPEINVVQPFESAGFKRRSVTELSNPFARPWLQCVVDHPKFTGGLKSMTVTRFAVESGIQAVQVELSSAVRVVYSPRSESWPIDYSGEADGIVRVVSALQALIFRDY